MKTIGVVDTTFSRIDMGNFVFREIESLANKNSWKCNVVRRTVPGFKDLAVECLRLHDEVSFDICMAIGWVGGMPIDSQCGHEASLAISNAQLLIRTHILEVFIHEQESSDPAKLTNIALGRAKDHAHNALYMLFEPEKLSQWAGTGRRQGGTNAGPLVT